MLCRLLRMVEREGELMALHGEDAAQAMGRGLQVGREMGGVGHQSDIADLVLCRHDGEGVVEQHVCPVDGLKIFLAALAVVVEHLQHVAAQSARLGNGLQFLSCLGVTHEPVGGIPALGHASPGGPAPDAEGRGEKVTVAATVCRHLVDVEACNHRDPLIVLITVEHLLAKGEERLGRHHIILEDDDLVGQ